MKPLSFLEKHIVLLLVDLCLSGAKPVYMDCHFDERWGIPLGVSLENAIKTMDAIQRQGDLFSVSKLLWCRDRYCKYCDKEAHKRG